MHTFGATSTLVANSIITKSTFNNKSQQLSTETSVSNGEKKVSTNQTFDTTFKYKPLRTEIADYAKDGITNNKLYVDQTYNALGQQSTVTQPLNLADISNSTTKAKYTTTYSYLNTTVGNMTIPHVLTS